MNILFIKHFFVGFMVSEIPIVSVFGYYPYSDTFPYSHYKWVASTSQDNIKKVDTVVCHYIR